MHDSLSFLKNMFPIISAISESFANVLDKIIIKNDSLSSKQFTSILFVFMAFFCVPLLYFFEISEVSLLSIGILSFIIVASALQNFLFYVVLSKKDLSAIEPINNSEPIIAILFAFLFFPEERSALVFILGFITTFALIYLHVDYKEFKKEKIHFDKYSTILIFSLFLSSFLYIAYKYALDFVSPITLYVIRTVGVFMILSFLFRPKIFSLQKSQTMLFTFSAFLYSIAAITQYFAISTIGVGLSILILSLSPVIIYFSSHFLLKEKISIHQIFSSIVIIICVAIATFYGF